MSGHLTLRLNSTHFSMSLHYLCLIRVCVSSLFGTCVAFRRRSYFLIDCLVTCYEVMRLRLLFMAVQYVSFQGVLLCGIRLHAKLPPKDLWEHRLEMNGWFYASATLPQMVEPRYTMVKRG